jgi:hypothetical protein
MPTHRVGYCLKQPKNDRVQIMAHGSGANCRCHYRGLSRCADVWVCPVCAVRIAQQRAREVEAAGVEWVRRGGAVAMVTLTMPHTRADGLSELLDMLGDALRRTRRGAPWKRVAQRHGIRGAVTAKESTWGADNGWHPHFHVAMFVAGEADAEAMERDIGARWRAMVEKVAGREPSYEYGCKVSIQRDTGAGRTAGAYLAKGSWGVGQELTGDYAKAARGDRFNPKQILCAYAEAREVGDREAEPWGRRFIEYADAYRGRQQLTWTPGLKADLGIDQLDDAEAADAEPAETEVIATMGPRAWAAVRAEAAQGALLRLAAEQGFQGVERWLAARGLDCGINDPPFLEALSPDMASARAGP